MKTEPLVMTPDSRSAADLSRMSNGAAGLPVVSMPPPGRRIKVLSLITGLHVGGAEKLLLAQLRCIDRARFDPVIATVVGGELIPEFERSGIRVHNLAMRHLLDLGAVLRLRAIIKQERPDILHTHLFHADLLGRLVGAWQRVPVMVTTLHMLPKPQHRWWCQPVDQWCQRFSAAFVSISEEIKQIFVNAERLDPAKVRIIPNAVEPLSPPDAATCARLRREVDVPDDGVLVGVVSRLEEPRKALDVMIEAVAHVAPRWPGLRCVLIGEGAWRPALEAQIQRLGMAAHVRMLGTRHDVSAWLSAMDLFVLPSRDEGLPMAIIEAMSAGRPIIATPVGGVPELITHEEHGLLVPPSDVAALAEAIERLLRDRALARRLGQAAQAKFAERFDMRQMIRRTEHLYEEVLDDGLRLKAQGSRGDELSCIPVLENGVSQPDPSAFSLQPTASGPSMRSSRRIKVLEVVTTLDPGGVTTYLANLIQRIDRSRFEVVLVCGPDAMDEPLAKRLGVPVRIVGLTKPVDPLKDLRAMWQLCRLIWRERPDIVHTNMSKADMLGGLAGRLCGVPCVVSTAHGPLRVTFEPSRAQRFYDGLERFLYRHVHHHVISVSESTTQELIRKRKLVDRSKCVTVVNGIDAQRLVRPGARERVRAALGLTEEQPVIVMVARFKAPKTPEVLVEAMAMLAPDYPDAVCLLVGDGPDEELILTQIRQQSLERRVRLLGRRDDVPDLLNAADVFVLSSYSEGMSVSVLEAMAAGCAIVASRVGGMEELIDHGRGGLLVPPRDPLALAAALRQLLADRAARRAMGNAARARILEQFDLSTHVSKTEAALCKALADRPIRRCQKPSSSPANPSGLERLRRHLEEEGLASTFTRLLYHAIKPWYGAQRYWLMRRSLAEPIMPMAAKTPCTIRQATPADLDLLCGVGFYSRQALATLLASPTDACFLAERDGQVLGFQWVALGERDLEVSPMPRPVKLARDEAYFYNARALKPYRGQGVVFAVGSHALAWLKTRGVDTVYSLIRHWNAPSIALFEKWGFSKLERFTMRRWGRAFRVRSEQPRLASSSPVRVLVIRDEAMPESAAIERLRATARTVRVMGMRRAASIRHEARGAQDAWLPEGGRHPLAWWRVLALCVRVIREEGIEIIHCQNSAALELGRAAARWAGVRHLTISLTEEPRLGPAWIPGWRRAKTRRWLRGADAVFVYDAELARQCVSAGWVRPERLHRLRHETLLVARRPAMSTAQARIELGLPDRGPIVTSVGRLAHDTAPWRFVELCAALGRLMPECRFVFSGDGPLRALISRYAEQLGLGSRITWLRQDDQLRTLIAASDVLVELPDRRRTLAAVEATSAAKPIIPLTLPGAAPESALEAAVDAVAQALSGLPVASNSWRQGSLGFGSSVPDLSAVTLSDRREPGLGMATDAQLTAAWHDVLDSDLQPIPATRWTAHHGYAAFSRHAR